MRFLWQRAEGSEDVIVYSSPGHTCMIFGVIRFVALGFVCSQWFF